MSCLLEQSVLSLEYINVEVGAIDDDPLFDPTGYVVQMAIIPRGDAVELVDFVNASWTQIDAKHHARCLVGPGGAIVPSLGQFDCYIRIQNSPEATVKYSGVIVFF